MSPRKPMVRTVVAPTVNRKNFRKLVFPACSSYTHAKQGSRMVNAEPECDSVTLLIHRLKDGDSRAPDAIWEKCFLGLVDHARKRLRAHPGRMADEEDIALSAMNSFFEGAKRERFPALNNRDDLWKLLFIITARKATALRRKANAGKRPDAHMVGSPLNNTAEEADWLYEAVGNEPTPAAAAMFADEVQRLLKLLPSDEFRQIAALKLEGYTNKEISEQMNTYEEKIRRKIEIIRGMWKTDEEI